MSIERETLSVSGLKELNKALVRLQGKTASSISRSGIAAAGREVQKAAQARVPVDTGNLKRSIGVKVKRLGRTGYAADVGPMKRTSRGKVEIGAGTFGTLKFVSDGYYGHMVEYGTDPHLIPYKGQKLKRGPGRTKVARNQILKINGNIITGPIQHHGAGARPFMRPAWQAVKGRLPNIMGKTIWKRIEREARKAKK